MNVFLKAASNWLFFFGLAVARFVVWTRRRSCRRRLLFIRPDKCIYDTWRCDEFGMCVCVCEWVIASSVADNVHPNNIYSYNTQALMINENTFSVQHEKWLRGATFSHGA